MDKTRLRLLDANFNRAREALRVMEDYARFQLNDPQLSKSAKELRHDLCQCIAQIPFESLLGARDIVGDVGTQISTAGEKRREDELSVVQAAAKRLTEALRCLEEYSKIENEQIAERIEKLRYRSYDLEKRILLRVRCGTQFADVRLYVLLTESLCRLPILEVAEQVLAGGADCVQLREKDKTDEELLELACEISRLCHKADALFIMNDRPDLAVLADADGVHLGQNDLPVVQARKIINPRMIIGKSTHSIAEAEAAIAEQPDYIAVGLIFPSLTKPKVVCSGPQLIREVRQLCPVPLIAIGGITAENAHQALAAGASGVAVCQAAIASDNPETACREIKQRISSDCG